MSDEEVLSQDEVDALLDGVDKGNVPTEGNAEDQDELRLVDFASQKRVVRSQFPVLERIHERMAKKLAFSIYDTISREVEVNIGEMRILNFSEYMSSLAMPTAMNVIRISPLRGKALLNFDNQLAFSLVENYFGGDGRFKQMMEEREFTPTELRIIEIIQKIVFRDIEEAWKPIMAVEFEVLATEMNPQLVNIHSPDDMMLITPFNINFEEGGGELHMVLPYIMLEPIRDLLDLGSARTDDEIDPNWVRSLREEIMFASLELNATLAEEQINLRDVIKLKVGDVIPIEMPEEIILNVEDIPMFRTKYGMSRDKHALKVLEKIKR